MKEEPYFDTHQAAELLDVSHGHVGLLCRTCSIGQKLRGVYRLTQQDVDQLQALLTKRNPDRRLGRPRKVS